MMLTVEVFVIMLGLGLATPILPLYAQSFGLGATAVGSLVTVFGLARIVVNIPAGQWAARFGRRRLLILGPLLTAAGSFGFALTDSFVQLLLWRVLQGFGSALLTTTAMIVLADISTPSDRGRIMSLYQGSLLLGAGAGPALGGIVAGLWGYAVPFLIFGGLTFVAAIWALVQMPETRDLARPRSAPAPPAASVGDSDVATASAARRPAAPSLGAVLRLLLTDRSFLLVSGVTLTTFLTRTGGQMTLLPLLGHERLGMSEAAIGGVFTLIAVVNFATLYVAGALADRFGRKAVIVPAGVLTAVAIGLYGFAASTSSFVFVSVLLGVGIGLAGPAPAAYATDIMPAGAIGPGMGLYRTISDLGFVLGPIALGAIVDVRGYGLAFGLNAALMLMTTLAFAAWAHETAAAPHDAAATSRN